MTDTMPVHADDLLIQMLYKLYKSAPIMSQQSESLTTNIQHIPSLPYIKIY